MSSKICVLSSFGRAVQTQAVAAATIGAAKLVPLARTNPLGSNEDGTATQMSSPGAARSIPEEGLEKRETWFRRSVEATVSTRGSVAG
jgi:hypothetical protein